jgi:hypothetical protein
MPKIPIPPSMSAMGICRQLSGAPTCTIQEPGANGGENPAANLNDFGWVVV